MKTQRFLIVAMLLLTCIPPLGADDLSTAIRQLKEHATQRDAEAQHNLGVLYHHGQGVPQDYLVTTNLFLVLSQGCQLSAHGACFLYLQRRSTA